MTGAEDSGWGAVVGEMVAAIERILKRAHNELLQLSLQFGFRFFDLFFFDAVLLFSLRNRLCHRVGSARARNAPTAFSIREEQQAALVLDFLGLSVKKFFKLELVILEFLCQSFLFQRFRFVSELINKTIFKRHCSEPNGRLVACAA